MKVQFKADYTKRADDLYSAYEFIDSNSLTLENVKKAHAILSSNLLPDSQQGFIRTNPMFVINSDDQIEYVATSPQQVNSELEKNYYLKLKGYYNNIKKFGLEYEELDYKRSLDFLLMTVQSLNEE